MTNGLLDALFRRERDIYFKAGRKPIGAKEGAEKCSSKEERERERDLTICLGGFGARLEGALPGELLICASLTAVFA